MTITLKRGYFVLAAAALLSLAAILFSNASHLRAAISNFTPSTCYTAAATTSPTYQTPGVATSTVTCPMGPDGATSAALIVEVNASSTASVNNIFAEESMDNIDWFPINLSLSATTSPTVTVTNRNPYVYTFASSTIGGQPASTGTNGVNATNNRNHVVLDLPVRMRYVRAYSACALGGTNCAVWMKIIPRSNIN